MRFSTVPSTVVLVLALTCSTSISVVSAKLQCIDEQGKPVDWFIVYKLPYLSAKNDRVLFSGHNYAYLTSNQQQGDWHLSANHINDADKSILSKTLSPILGENRKKSEFSTVFYNDQPPTDENVASSYAHSKGVLATDSKQGFWLIHTVPGFVFHNKSFEYPSTGGRYGQVAMCISLSITEIEKIVTKNFLVAHPFVYSIEIADETKPLGAALKQLKGHHWTPSTSYSDTELTSIGGTKFRSFYKSPKDHLDLYAGIVAKQLQTGLLVETWRKGAGNPLDSDCKLKKEQVENVVDLKIKFANSDKSDSFDYLNDHSKWAISAHHSSGSDSVHSVCLGDINRMESQFKRGGGTTCLFNQSVWKSFNAWVLNFEKCGGKQRHRTENDDDDSDDGDKEKFHDGGDQLEDDPQNKDNKNKSRNFFKNFFKKLPKWVPFTLNIEFPAKSNGQ